MKTEKIGILTFHRAVNYGAVLQAYALSRALRTLGADCALLDYRCPAVERQYALRGPRACSSARNFFAHNLNVLCRRRRARGFAAFRRALPLSPRCDRGNIGEVAKDYTTLLCGSDQVWNPACHKDDPAYFLTFAAGQKKVAYAASVGSLSAFTDWGKEPLTRLADFAALSAREADAAAYLGAALGRDCPHTVDPVWLLPRAAWEEIAVAPKEKGPYIFLYNLMDYPYMRALAARLSGETGMPVLSVSKSVIGDFHYRFTRIRSNATPGEFLGYIRGASLVLTDSFHGTSFSMLFSRPFLAAADPRGENTNARLSSLLAGAGLSRHLLCPDTAKTCTAQDAAYDGTRVQAEMAEKIAASRLYLQKALGLANT